ncbi:hypothetical protein THAOC_22210 [Thalassiosira oceanica]|uniref:Uncharacterized protein n=1 Tax=Thalassiosira oceanica TaxID=159749 RepID=K0RZ60_THAOC|nr:hypothetical protein THAOC_22210 [Thalassiosira oceanica]|eukprot:EJK57714.1 hypothetical protein THAOC_22210 [Thalassiosira oceanica]
MSASASPRLPTPLPIPSPAAAGGGDLRFPEYPEGSGSEDAIDSKYLHQGRVDSEDFDKCLKGGVVQPHFTQGSRRLAPGPCVNSAAFTVPYTGTTSRSIRASASSRPRQYSRVIADEEGRARNKPSSRPFRATPDWRPSSAGLRPLTGIDQAIDQRFVPVRPFPSIAPSVDLAAPGTAALTWSWSRSWAPGRKREGDDEEEVGLQLASFLHAEDLCQVKATCKALGSDEDATANGLSIADEAARRLYLGASDEEKAKLPRHDGESWTEL